MNNNDRQECSHPGTVGLILAFITGAGIGASAMLLTRKAQAAIAPTAEQLLARCDKAVDALEIQILQSA